MIVNSSERNKLKQAHPQSHKLDVKFLMPCGKSPGSSQGRMFQMVSDMEEKASYWLV